jgi:hypothetical protein
MNPNYQVSDTTVEIIIHKPLYGSFCYIRDLYVNNAIKYNKKLKITIPQGTFLCDPVEWKESGKQIEKVFLKPNEPMVLWGNYVVKLHGSETMADKEREVLQSTLF